MDDTFSPRFDQRSGVKPITFWPEYQGTLLKPVTLPIRPEDLAVTYPNRLTVHQTLGRQTQGWVDSFGAGLPMINISGHTGWGYKPGLKKDGFQSFLDLKSTCSTLFPALKDVSIKHGQPPEGAKLIFVDLLDELIWSVAPTQYVLRRSKSRPLLFQYNIGLQVVDTNVDNIKRFLPQQGGVSAGLTSLIGALSKISSLLGGFGGGIIGALGSIAGKVMGFVKTALSVIGKVQGYVNAAKGLIVGVTAMVVGIAKSVASVGKAIFQTFAAISTIGSTIKNAFSSMASAFNEVVCIFSNSLRPRSSYQDYSGVFGASNCSSTTSGTPASVYAGKNVFGEMFPTGTSQIKVSSPALFGMKAINNSDPVLSPMPMAEIGRNLGNITSGLSIA